MAITKESLRKRMGLNIRRERVAINMSIDELAGLLNITPGFLGLIERGERGITSPHLYKLADIFDISVDSLFADEQQDYQEMSRIDILQKKTAGLIADLSEQHLDFIIESIRRVHEFKRT